MTKLEYLNELERALKAAGVRDCADIIEEYSEHFDMKAGDGYGEEEIAARLASPMEIAGQFREIGAGGGQNTAGKALAAAGLVFLDLFAGAWFIMMYAWVVALGAVAVACAAAGVFVITGIPVTVGGVVLIPYMPYICALLLGIALLGMAVLSAAGTEYCRLYVMQMFRVYARWHGIILGKNEGLLPPLSVHPVIKPKKRRLMRSITLVSVTVLAVTLIAGLGSMMIAAGSLEPWHVWQWFA